MSSGLPPPITHGILPRWVRARDIVLTLLAWLVLFWLMRHLLLTLWVGIAWVTGTPSGLPPDPIRPKWDLLWPFLLAAGFLMAVIAAFTWRRRILLRATPLALLEPAVDSAAHGKRFGLDAMQIADLRSNRVTVVDCDAEGQIVVIEERLR